MTDDVNEDTDHGLLIHRLTETLSTTPNQLETKLSDHFTARKTGRGSGHKQAKRVVDLLQQRSSGDHKVQNFPAFTADAVEKVQADRAPIRGLAHKPAWTFLGPSKFVAGEVAPTSKLTFTPGLGRLNAVAVDPSDLKRIYVGSASGGIWRSNDAGSTWEPLTDKAQSLSYSDMVVDPKDPRTLYALTGDGDGRILPSIGVLKSTDHGASWERTGLQFRGDTLVYGYRLSIDPADPSHLLAATTMGLYRTQDSGKTWELVSQGSFFDVRFAPGSNTVIYASTSDSVLRSTNGGASFSVVQRETSLGKVYRIELAVSPAAPDMVYAILAGESGFFGMLRSTDKGETWFVRSVKPNILDASPNGNLNISQAWYDMAIAVDPFNADIVNVGGINTWRSMDGGVTWERTSFWQYASKEGIYVHPDVHRMMYVGNKFFVANDGGLYLSEDNGTTWTDLSEGLAITEAFRVASGVGDDGPIYFGAQDNGSNLLEDETAIHIWGGDGTECLVAPDNDKRVFICQQFGSLYRSVSGAFSFSQAWPNAPSAAPKGASYIMPYQLHPQAPQVIYAGYVDVYLGIDTGRSINWTKLTNGVLGKSGCVDLKVAPSDARIVYAAKPGALYRSYGPIWNKIPNGWGGTASINRVEVDPEDPLHVWVVLSGYIDGHKVYERSKTATGIYEWRNITGDLPNIAFYAILAEGGADKGVYLGSDIGIFYRNEKTKRWAFVSEDMPRVIVRDLMIPEGSNRLLAATYGRGIWETDLINPPLQSNSK